MVDAQPTWKDRVEKYKKLEELWSRKPHGQAEEIVSILKETSIPALEAGLSAITPLAKANAVGEYTKDLLSILFKNVASSKPTMKKTVREIMAAQARHNPSLVVVAAMGCIKDKNPKIVAETIKILWENSALLMEHLTGPVLPHAPFLFGHSTGAVREEATKLFQILAEKEPERVGEAVKTLKPIQVKEIFNPRPEAERAEEPRAAPVEACAEPASEKQAAAPQRERASSASSGNATMKDEPSQRKAAECKSEAPKCVVKELPKNFYERFASSLWKERLVMEELDELLGERGTLSTKDIGEVTEAIIKKAGESNNKVMIAGMSVVLKIAQREKLQDAHALRIAKAIEKRLKDKKEQVQQAVSSAILALLNHSRAGILAELVNTACTDKTLRHGVLKTLESALAKVTEKEAEDAKAIRALVLCTKDQSADTRGLACACMARVLSKREEAPSQAEIEQLGVERLLAVKIEAQAEEMFQKKDAEISAIIESLCENIRNTSIKISEPVTPIRGGECPNTSTLEGSPIITRSLQKEKPGNVFAGEAAPASAVEAHKPQKAYVEYPAVCPIMNYVMTGEVEGTLLATLVSALGGSPLVDTRILSILYAVNLPEGIASQLQEKMGGLFASDTHTSLLAEGVKTKLARKLQEKNAFEERCLFAALTEDLLKGESVPQERILHALASAEKRSSILKEEHAFIIVKAAGEMGYLEALSGVERVFPASKVFTILTTLAETNSVFLERIYFLLQKPHVGSSALDGVLNTPRFLSLLDRSEAPAAQKVLSILKKESIVAGYSPYAKKVRRTEGAQDAADINALLNDIIDQNSQQSQESLGKLEKISAENISGLLRSASTVVNVLLLQLNDALSSGGSSFNVHTIIKIIKRVCESEVFLATLDAGTLLSLVSDYIVIITGQIPRGSASPEGIKKECGESLLRMCANAPFLHMFKIYMNLLSNRYREEKVREILVKLLWKHSKMTSSVVADKAVVLGMVSRLNTFYAEYRGDIKSEPLISKVLQLHLIEILKHYGDDFLRTFKVTGPVLQQVHALGGLRT
ncbi:uncharacterized protein NEMAJ01_1144 [Nematocida major]|uniref:uncharacterized protein n=1 Tax=Nematocida major TaxID=1912982 RepID=UPI00200782D4|nr:uncharacterized protein NEMAJ01_1144 [Nematocida major]KAH9386248.1 hypothetical protein NEMAJ01_1144 [Nematocida major]